MWHGNRGRPQSARSGNVAQLHEVTVDHHGDALAIESHGSELTHAQLDHEAAAVAGGLHDIGLEPGDVLMVYLPNCPQFLIGSLGAFRAGVIVSPVNPQYRARNWPTRSTTRTQPPC